MALVENRDKLEGGDVSIRLPGVRKGDMATRNFKPEVNVYSVRFSPNAQSWAAATTEGLLIYSLDRGIVFDPLNLSLEVTPKAARESLAKQEYSTAILMALKLNENKLIEEIIEQIPYIQGMFAFKSSRLRYEIVIKIFLFFFQITVELVATSLPNAYVERILEFVSKQISNSHHIEFYLNWSTKLLTAHAPKENIFKQQSLVSIQDSLTRKYDQLSKVCDFNKYTLKVLIEMGEAKASANANGTNGEADDDSDDSDDEDVDENNLMLIRQQTNGDHDDDSDVEMASEEEEETSDDDSL